MNDQRTTSCNCGQTERRTGSCGCASNTWARRTGSCCGAARDTNGTCGCRSGSWARRTNSCGCDSDTWARRTGSCGCGCKASNANIFDLTSNTGTTWKRRDCNGCATTEQNGCRVCAEGAAEDSALSGRSLAMVYSPTQHFENLYDPRQGLCNGTVFCELNKPFSGCGRCQ